MGTLSLNTSILIETLHQIELGKPCTIFADNPQQVLFKLEDCDIDRLANMRIIQVPLELKTVNEGIDKTITALADIVQALLPEWNNLVDEQEQSINRRWRSIAAALCEQEKVPLPKGYSVAQQARQLSLCLNQGHTVILLFPQGNDSDQTQLYSLARVSEWLALQTNTRVCLLLPNKYGEQAALDPVTYGAVTLASPRTEALRPSVITPLSWVFPFLGRPHPCSPGEQLLARHISKDDSLNSLFFYNYRINGCRGGSFICDLVWPDGQLIIEIDGYRFHCDEESFRADRRRDRELLLSGYRVMRLPHNEVIDDPRQALMEINDMVCFIRSRTP